ncbi:major facilitator superfamily domain-containing protein, partial [Phascolomyces articulosus]
MVLFNRKQQQSVEKTRKKPFFLKHRSSSVYILAAVSFSFFTNEMLYGIITPIMPFVLDSMRRGIDFNSMGTGEQTAYDIAGHEGDISSDTGILLAIYYAGFGGASPIFGYLSDRVFHNRKSTMLLGIIILIGSLFLFLFVTHYWMFALGRLLQGLGAGGVATMGYVLVADTSPADVLGTQLGRAYMCYMAGLAAGGPAGALFLHYGFKVPFIFSLAFVGIELVLCIFIIERRNMPKHWFENLKNDGDGRAATTETQYKVNNENDSSGFGGDDRSNGLTMNKSNLQQISDANNTAEKEYTLMDVDLQESATATPLPLRNSFSSSTPSTLHSQQLQQQNDDINNKNIITTTQLLKSSRIWTIILVSFCSGWAVITFEPTLPIYLNEEWGYNTSEIGLLLVIQLIPTAVASLISGYMYDRIGARFLCFITLILGGISLAVSGIPNRHTAGGAIPLIATTATNEFFASVYKAATLPEASLAAKALANGNDSGNARAYGLTNMAFAAGCLTSPLLSGYLYEQTSFFLMCIITSSILFLAAPFAFIFLGGKIIGFPCIKKFIS